MLVAMPALLPARMGSARPHDVGMDSIRWFRNESLKIRLAHAKARTALVKARSWPQGTMALSLVRTPIAPAGGAARRPQGVLELMWRQLKGGPKAPPQGMSGFHLPGGINRAPQKLGGMVREKCSIDRHR